MKRVQKMTNSGVQPWRVVIIIFASAFVGHADQFSRRLVRDLFPAANLALVHGPNPLIRPVNNFSEPLIVSLGLTVMSVMNLNFVEHSMTSYAWVSMEWVDPSLAWDEKEYGGVDSLSVPTSLIFTPDITVYNDLSGDVSLPKEKVLTFVRNNGHVHWIVPVILKTSCNSLDNDNNATLQNCSIKFGSWIHDASKIELRVQGAALDSESELKVNATESGTSATGNTTNNERDSDPVDVGVDISSVVHPVGGEWKLLRATGVRNVVQYACCPEAYNDVTFTLQFARIGQDHIDRGQDGAEEPVIASKLLPVSPQAAEAGSTVTGYGIWSRLPSWRNIVG